MCVHAWMAVFLKDSHLPKVACTCFKVHMCMGGSICVLCWIVSRCGNLHTCTCAFFLTVCQAQEKLGLDALELGSYSVYVKIVVVFHFPSN